MLLSYLCAKQKSLRFSLMEKSVLLNRSLVQRYTAKAKKRLFVTHILPSSPNYLLYIYISTRVKQDFNIYETWIVTAAVVDWTDALFPPSNTIYLEHANDPLAEKDMLYFSVLNPHYFLHSPHHHEVVFALLCINVFLPLQQSQMLIQSHYLRPQSETNGHDLPCRIFSYNSLISLSESLSIDIVFFGGKGLITQALLRKDSSWNIQLSELSPKSSCCVSSAPLFVKRKRFHSLLQRSEKWNCLIS